MFKLKRNQVIITALVVMIAVAGYLNYTDSLVYSPTALSELEDNTILADFTELTDLEFAELIEIDFTVTPPAPTAEDFYGEEAEQVAALTPANGLNDGAFFVQARLEREQSRARQREVLLELINNDNVEQEVRAQSAENMLTIQRRIEKESSAEALIESRGFNEVFVRIGDSSVDVIVNKESLSDAELAQIEDIILRKIGSDTHDIRIATMR
ncbi:MAG: SpoIIIAH-like family protein [Defluviitaleaceae bacterium]|nr:SpoIIIAH-like family protein [Defluviitaleaceae bacterium]